MLASLPLIGLNISWSGGKERARLKVGGRGGFRAQVHRLARAKYVDDNTGTSPLELYYLSSSSIALTRPCELPFTFIPF